jgi:aminopeptidase N
MVIASLVFFSAVLCRASAASLAEQTPFIETLDYKLDVSIDYKQETIAADCRMTISNSGETPVHEVPILLYRLLNVESVKNAAGEPMVFSQQVRQFEDWEKFQVNFIVVNLPKPLLKDENTTLDIRYGGHLLGYSETGMLYVKDKIDKAFTILRPDCKAFPQVGYLSWKVNRKGGFNAYDYVLNVTVPEGLVVANGGELVGKKQDNGKVTYTYKNIKPAWRIDIAVSDYKILKSKSGKLKIFHFPRHQEGADDVMQAMEKTMVIFKGWFGPLKEMKSFSVIEIPGGFGSQADVTSVLQTADAFETKGEHYQLYHELSHLWNVEMLDPLPCRFESEGLASFLQYLVQEKLENKQGAVEKAFTRYRKSYVETCKKNSEYLDIPMIDHGKKGTTNLSYTKGMLFFALLHEMVGEQEFFDLIKGFYREYRSGATTVQFADYLKKHSSMPLSRLVQDWIYGTQSSQLVLKHDSLAKMLKEYK